MLGSLILGNSHEGVFLPGPAFVHPQSSASGCARGARPLADHGNSPLDWAVFLCVVSASLIADTYCVYIYICLFDFLVILIHVYMYIH